MSRNVRTVVILVVACSVCYVLHACFESQSDTSANTMQRLSIVAIPPSGLWWRGPVEVAMSYEDNPIAADRDFRDSLLLMSGVVKSIERRGANEAEVRLGANFNPNFDSPRYQVRCLFNRDQIEKVALLRVGAKAEFVGICNGYVFGVVELRDCALASSWSRKNQAGLGVSADEVMRRVAGYERFSYPYDESEGDMVATFAPDTDPDPRISCVRFLGALDDPYEIFVTHVDVAAGGTLSPTAIQILSAALKSDWVMVREWLDGVLVSLEKRDERSVRKSFGRFVVKAKYHAQLELRDVFALAAARSDAESLVAKQELQEKLASSQNLRMSITITTASADGAAGADRRNRPEGAR